MKRGDPVTLLLGSGTALFSGAFFPANLLPSWLQPVSAVLPTTHAVEALRLAIFRGLSVGELQRPLFGLASAAIVILPLGLWTLSRAIESGRRDGTLLHY